MLREGLNHLDRIPHPPAEHGTTEVAGWLRHIIAHYKKLPDVVFFASSAVPPSSTAFTTAKMTEAFKVSSDFGMWGTRAVQLPGSKLAEFCARVAGADWAVEMYGTKFKHGCPERVVTMSDPLFFVSKRRIKATPLEAWKKVLKAVTTSASSAELIEYGWPMLFGQPSNLPARFMHQH